MKMLSMVMILVMCATVGPAQGLQRPRRTLPGNRLQRPAASEPQKQQLHKTTTNGVEWTYEVVDGGVFLGSGDMRTHPGRVSKLAVSDDTSGTLTIPGALAGMPVRGIGSFAFDWCRGLTSVTIPDSVTNIGNSAFADCSGLTSLTMSDGVTGIGSGAFKGCSGLADQNGFVIINNTLCDYLGTSSEIVIPDGVTSIGSSAFLGCSGLTSVTIP